MQISFLWLKEYIDFNNTHEEIADSLTNCGLEVESITPYYSIKGGLSGLIIGKVISKTNHPNAERLSITSVDIGSNNPLHIICGAPNVKPNQKVVVATIGTTLYQDNGTSFTIKKSKIRGEISEGMICAEEEIGLGDSHEGIMVLNADAIPGMLASEYFNVKKDYIFTIGLTPNRGDATSHIGAARDLSAIYRKNNIKLRLPSVENFKVNKTGNPIEIVVENDKACIRYSGVRITGVQVGTSPDWLKNRLKSVGLVPINNIVDITNFVLYETGQPLHAFDADKIKGNTVIVKTLNEGQAFVTLDGIERKLKSSDLMICNKTEPMCIAGVFGGSNSGITEQTKEVFLESACFNPTYIRKTAKHHNLHTDASFRFERSTDPEATIYVLKRAALLIQEICGGKISDDIVDVYPKPISKNVIDITYNYIKQLIGKKIAPNEITDILSALGFDILKKSKDKLSIAAPTYKSDVTRPCDIVEEIVRIYGLNKVEPSDKFNFSLPKDNSIKVHDALNNMTSFLVNNGFNEIVTNSIVSNTNHLNTSDLFVNLLNPLSVELNTMRTNSLYGGLEAIAYNKNRQQHYLKLFEVGKTYQIDKASYIEKEFLSIWISGNKWEESWNTSDSSFAYFDLKGFVVGLLKKCNIWDYEELTIETSDIFSEGSTISYRGKKIAQLGCIKKEEALKLNIKSEIFFADLCLPDLIESSMKNPLYQDIPIYPVIRRDLALMVPKQTTFNELKTIALNAVKNPVLKKINLFDVYEDEKKLGKNIKSYALSFTFQDKNRTLNDKYVDKLMKQLIASLRKNTKCEIR